MDENYEIEIGEILSSPLTDNDETEPSEEPAVAGEIIRPKQLNLDVRKLALTRAIIQASSGQGKSWLMRLIAEQSESILPVILIDPEGEYVSLRENYDFLIVGGEDADVPLVPSFAETLALQILEKKFSVICDLSTTDQEMGELFLYRFFEAFLNAPKHLWTVFLLAIDEAHLFAPERGKTICKDTIKQLGARGRKRGIGTILLTQRISQVAKDVVGQANNVIIGGCVQDIDRYRAVETLGLSRKDHIEIKLANPGEFFAVGPAFSQKGMVKFKSGQVTTKHEITDFSSVELKKIGSLDEVLKSLQAEVQDHVADEDDYDDGEDCRQEKEDAVFLSGLERFKEDLKKNLRADIIGDINQVFADNYEQNERHLIGEAARLQSDLLYSLDAHKHAVERAVGDFTKTLCNLLRPPELIIDEGVSGLSLQSHPAQLTPSVSSILDIFLRHNGKKSDEDRVVLDRKVILGAVSLAAKTVENALTTLKKLDLIERVDRGKYRLNNFVALNCFHQAVKPQENGKKKDSPGSAVFAERKIIHRSPAAI